MTSRLSSNGTLLSVAMVATTCVDADPVGPRSIGRRPSRLRGELPHTRGVQGDAAAVGSVSLDGSRQPCRRSIAVDELPGHPVRAAGRRPAVGRVDPDRDRQRRRVAARCPVRSVMVAAGSGRHRIEQRQEIVEDRLALLDRLMALRAGTQVVRPVDGAVQPAGAGILRVDEIAGGRAAEVADGVRPWRRGRRIRLLPKGVSPPPPSVSASSSVMNSPPVRHSPIEPVPRPWKAPASATKVPTRCHFLGCVQLIGGRPADPVRGTPRTSACSPANARSRRPHRRPGSCRPPRGSRGRHRHCWCAGSADRRRPAAEVAGRPDQFVGDSRRPAGTDAGRADPTAGRRRRRRCRGPAGPAPCRSGDSVRCAAVGVRIAAEAADRLPGTGAT